MDIATVVFVGEYTTKYSACNMYSDAVFTHQYIYTLGVPFIGRNNGQWQIQGLKKVTIHTYGKRSPLT